MLNKYKFTVDCDECSFEEGTDSYDRAKDIYESHHIVTGHRPPIEEN